MLIYSILSKRYTGPSRRSASSPSCKISSFNLQGVRYNRYTCIFYLGISVEGGVLHDLKANASMTSRSRNLYFSSHVISYTYEKKKQKSHDNCRSEKNCMQLFVIRNRIRTILVLSYRVRT